MTHVIPTLIVVPRTIQTLEGRGEGGRSGREGGSEWEGRVEREWRKGEVGGGGGKEGVGGRE